MPQSHSNDELLATLPLKRTWLDDIVEILLRRADGTGEVKAIALAMMKLGRNVGAAPEATITRTINNYCRDANDHDRVVTIDLFVRVSPGTYKLKTYPARPDLVELQDIRFSDPAYSDVWHDFCAILKRNPQWTNMTKRERLVAFANSVQTDGYLRGLIDRRREFFRDISSLTLSPSSTAARL